jgi:hypothetical protein
MSDNLSHSHFPLDDDLYYISADLTSLFPPSEDKCKRRKSRIINKKSLGVPCVHLPCEAKPDPMRADKFEWFEQSTDGHR